MAMRVAATRALTDMTAAFANGSTRTVPQLPRLALALRLLRRPLAAAEAAAEGKLAEAVAGGGASLSEAERFERAKTNKALFKEGVELFNKKPERHSVPAKGWPAGRRPGRGGALPARHA
jgi:hypothetical protein